MNTPRFFLTLALMTAAGSSQALTARIVTTTADSGAGSLREAIVEAVNGETISFAPTLNGATITLTSGELAITGLQLSIDASALSNGIKISGNNNSRIFRIENNIENNANVSLANLDIFNGQTPENGGGISVLESEVNFVEVTIRSCLSSFNGGGIYLNNATGSLDRCSFLGNDSTGFGGGMFLIGNSSPSLVNSVFSGNRSPEGGGITAFDSSPAIINCTIQGNSGTGIQLEYASAPTLRNTIVWGNRSASGSVASQQIRNADSSEASANVDYCLVEGVSSTSNNLDGTLSPNFINSVTPTNEMTPPTTNSDLRVFNTSPVQNVGDNGSNPTLLDRAGRTRIQNTTIDLGAFEGGYVTFAFLYPSLVSTDDANGNGLSNFLEYATGIDPTAPDDSSVQPQISTSGGFRFLTSSQRSNAADTTAVWQTSTTLASSSWQEMLLGINYTVDSTSNPTPSRQQVVMKLLDADSRRFYRQGFPNNN